MSDERARATWKRITDEMQQMRQAGSTPRELAQVTDERAPLLIASALREERRRVWEKIDGYLNEPGAMYAKAAAYRNSNIRPDDGYMLAVSEFLQWLKQQAREEEQP